MRNAILIVCLILVPFRFCLAQNLDVDNVCNKEIWNKVSDGFIAELQIDPLFPNIQKKNNNLFCRIKNVDLFKKEFWQIKKEHNKTFKFDTKKAARYEEIRQKYIADLEKKYPKHTANSEEGKHSQKTEIKDTAKQQHKPVAATEPEKAKGNNAGFPIGFWIVLCIALLELGVIIYLILKKRKMDNTDLQQLISKLEEQELDFKTQRKDLENQVGELEKQNNAYVKQIRQLQQKKEEPTKKNNDKKPQDSKKVIAKTPQQTKQKPKRDYSNCKYLYQINGNGYFGRAMERNDGAAYYCMFTINGDEAEFEFCGNAEEALLKYSSILDSVATYTGDPGSASRIENEEPGRIKYDSSTGVYKIIDKAKLKLY